MLSVSQFRIIKRAVKNRISNGEALEDVIKDYPKLTAAQIEQIKVEITDSKQ